MLAPLGFELANQADHDIPSPVEDGSTFIENALIKARAVSAASQLPAIADDSGLVVPALDGAPGIYSARYAGDGATDADNNAKLLEELAEKQDRRAHYYTSLVFLSHADDPAPLIAWGEWHGEILHSPQGDGGFGYDPLFLIPHLAKSAAQLPAQEKNLLSHRGKALTQLIAQLRQRYSFNVG